MSAWNDFVKKIYHEGHNKDKNYSFRQALKDASARKSEMGTTAATAMGVKSKTSRKSRKSRKSKKSRKTKKNRSRRSRK
jgi:hypothetical protein